MYHIYSTIGFLLHLSHLEPLKCIEIEKGRGIIGGGGEYVVIIERKG